MRILIADDSHFMRLAVRKMLQDCNDVEIVSECERADEAVVMTARLQPDVALLDFEMPGGDGYAMIRAIRVGAPNTKLLIFSSFIPDIASPADLDRDPVVVAIKAAGAHGCLPKGRGRNTFDILERQQDLLMKLRSLTDSAPGAADTPDAP
ncbi:MAG: response regulator [Planctomycetota bacterium]